VPGAPDTGEGARSQRETGKQQNGKRRIRVVASQGKRSGDVDACGRALEDTPTLPWCTLHTRVSPCPPNLRSQK